MPLEKCPLSFSFLACLSIALPLLAACATTPPKKSPDEAEAKVNEIRTLVATVNSKMDSLDAKLNSMNDKLDATRASSASPAASKATKSGKIDSVPVEEHPAEGVGTSINPPISAADPAAGFTQDDATDSFRKALIILQAEKFPEASLAFSGFVEQFPDHPLAGAAQYYIGEAYFQQKEYKLALHEFQRVLTSYDRSTHLSDTLERMAETEVVLKKPEDAARHRQLLTSLFPQSPAATVALRDAAKPSGPQDSAPHSAAHPEPGDSAPRETPPKVGEPKMTETPVTAPQPGLDQSPPAAAPAPALDGSKEESKAIE